MNAASVIIVGGGPGGISALLWCHSLGLRAVLLEQAAELGGQLTQLHYPVIDYPGLLPANGAALRDQLQNHVQTLGLAVATNCSVTAFDLAARRVCANGEWRTADALILALGVTQRRVGFAGETNFARHEDPHEPHTDYAGWPVCVIGGGDSAVENALILARVCPQVTLIHRSEQFRARAEWLAAARATPNLRIITNAVALHFELVAPSAISAKTTGTGRLLIRHTTTGADEIVPCATVFVRAGITPQTALLRDQLTLDEAGFIVTDAQQQTSVPNVYAVGDVCAPVCLSIATAIGHGAIAAKAIALQHNSENNFA